MPKEFLFTDHPKRIMTPRYQFTWWDRENQPPTGEPTSVSTHTFGLMDFGHIIDKKNSKKEMQRLRSRKALLHPNIFKTLTMRRGRHRQSPKSIVTSINIKFKHKTIKMCMVR